MDTRGGVGRARQGDTDGRAGAGREEIRNIYTDGGGLGKGGGVKGSGGKRPRQQRAAGISGERRRLAGEDEGLAVLGVDEQHRVVGPTDLRVQLAAPGAIRLQMGGPGRRDGVLAGMAPLGIWDGVLVNERTEVGLQLQRLQEVLRGPLHRSLHEVPTNQAEALAERLVALLEAIGLAGDGGDDPVEGVGHLDAARDAGALHAAGEVDGLAPDVEHGALAIQNPRRDGPRGDPVAHDTAMLAVGPPGGLGERVPGRSRLLRFAL